MHDCLEEKGGRMYTKARIASHPIHPMLVAFPIALYTATVVALIVHASTTDPFWYRAAMYTCIAGVVMAVITAVPGLVDLITLPAHSKARETGLRHAAFNVLALLFFAATGAVIYGNWSREKILADAAPLTLGILGLASTLAAGWYGWTLVQTHHVGVAPTDRSVTRPMEEIDDLDELFPPPKATPRTNHPVMRH
jgi:uncharacterized membrane protein